MEGYAYTPKSKNFAAVNGRAVNISNKSSVIVCDRIRGKSLEGAKKMLERVLEMKESIDGKYYTNTVKEILRLLKSVESNAEFKGLDAQKMIIHASAHEGYRFYRPRKFKMRRTMKKITHVQIVLEQR